MNVYDQSFAISIRGAAHTEQHSLLEDCSLKYDGGDFRVVALGGGSEEKQYFRSYLGARFAAEAALEKAKSFALSVADGKIPADQRMQRRIVQQLAGSILVAWRNKVQEHLEKYPFLPEELAGIEDDKYRKGYVEDPSQANREYAYRSGMMVAVVAENYCLVLRNSNGECSFLYENGEILEQVPVNRKCSNNFTTSMCERLAVQEFRYFCTEKLPAAVFLSTIGFRSCFEHEDEYHSYLKCLSGKLLLSVPDTGEYLKAYLPELSRKGSRKDMCLAVVWSTEMLKAAGILSEQQENKKKPTEPKRPPETHSENKSKVLIPVVGIAAAMAIAVTAFIAGGRSSSKKNESVAAEILDTEEKTEEKTETPRNVEEEPVHESLKEELTTETEKPEMPEEAMEVSTEVETLYFTLPETTAASPETIAAPPETTAAPPQTTAAQPETTAAPPQTTAAPPQTTAAPPQTTAAPPETTAAPPQTTAAPPETTAAQPETPPAPPQTAPAETTVSSGQEELNDGLQMWKVLQ